MNTNATMGTRLIAVFLDLITFFGFLVGLNMLMFTATESSFLFHIDTMSLESRLILIGEILGAFFICDVLCTRLMATTPGKLCMNCDVDFHSGNTFLHNIIRSFIKTLCLFTILPAIFSYVHATGNYDSKTFHDYAAKTNVTNTTRTPRFIGLLIFFTGLVLLVYFIVNYHSQLGLDFDILGLKHYKIFDLG
ncbi:MAG: RDD family protein [Clostridiales bacterium]|nr:RDD family protein [Clostridiales bacterium]